MVLSSLMSLKAELKIKSRPLVFSPQFLFRAELMPWSYYKGALSWCARECQHTLASVLNVPLCPFPPVPEHPSLSSRLLKQLHVVLTADSPG